MRDRYRCPAFWCTPLQTYFCLASWGTLGELARINHLWPAKNRREGQWNLQPSVHRLVGGTKSLPSISSDQSPAVGFAQLEIRLLIAPCSSGNQISTSRGPAQQQSSGQQQNCSRCLAQWWWANQIGHPPWCLDMVKECPLVVKTSQLHSLMVVVYLPTNP